MIGIGAESVASRLAQWTGSHQPRWTRKIAAPVVGFLALEALALVGVIYHLMACAVHGLTGSTGAARLSTQPLRRSFGLVIDAFSAAKTDSVAQAVRHETGVLFPFSNISQGRNRQLRFLWAVALVAAVAVTFRAIMTRPTELTEEVPDLASKLFKHWKDSRTHCGKLGGIFSQTGSGLYQCTGMRGLWTNSQPIAVPISSYMRFSESDFRGLGSSIPSNYTHLPSVCSELASKRATPAWARRVFRLQAGDPCAAVDTAYREGVAAFRPHSHGGQNTNGLFHCLSVARDSLPCPIRPPNITQPIWRQFQSERDRCPQTTSSAFTFWLREHWTDEGLDLIGRAHCPRELSEEHLLNMKSKVEQAFAGSAV